jgi:apolipoprotein N-acyltransferase
VLLSFANPPLDLGLAAFVAVIPLLWIGRQARPARGALLGLAFGLAYYGILLSWILPFGVIAWLPLVFVEALYAALFCGLLRILWRDERPFVSALAAAALWTGIDWFRGTWPLGGFTWGGLGYTQHDNALLLPLASITGVWGITFVVLLVNALLVAALLGARFSLARRVALVGVAVGAVAAPALVPVLAEWPSSPRAPNSSGNGAVDVAVVQGNVPRELASDRYLQSQVVAQNHIDLHRDLAMDPPDIAVWPENSLDSDPVNDPRLGRAVSESIEAVGSPTLVGAVTEAGGDRYFNQVLFYDGAGEVSGRYTKIHLVPFGEFVPFRRFLGWVDELRAVPRDLLPGGDLRLFDVAGARVATPICFENTFPDLFRRFVDSGATLVVLTTNNSSYALSPASRQHVIMSELRAVETDRYIVQAAISGISAVIDPDGRVLVETGLFEQTILRASVPVRTGRTIYTRFGDYFPLVCGLGSIAGLIAVGAGAARRRRTGGRVPAGRDGGPARGSSSPAGTTGVGATEPASSGRAHARPIAGGGEPRVLVVLPTYDERETVGEVIEGVLAAAPGADVLVIDDGSPDGTGELVEGIAGTEPRVRLVRRDGKQGLASAYLVGFRRGLDEGYDLIVEMDSDLSHRPEDLPRLLEGAATQDLTIGSRYVPGGAVTNWSRSRLALSRAANAYARTALRLPLADATSGFRVFRRHALQALLADGVTSEGYAFQIELAYRARRAGFSMGEVPITFREREHGRSKLSRRIVLEALWRVGSWGLRDRMWGDRDRKGRLGGALRP